MFGAQDWDHDVTAKEMLTKIRVNMGETWRMGLYPIYTETLAFDNFVSILIFFYLHRMNTTAVVLQQLAVHQGGYAAQGGQLKISENTHSLADEWLQEALLSFCLKPFREEEQYGWSSTEAPLAQVVQDYFSQQIDFAASAQSLARHYHLVSQTANLKNGEILVLALSNLAFGDQTCAALGVFHSSQKEPFVRVHHNVGAVELEMTEGIDLRKPEKGMLFLDLPGGESPLVLVQETGLRKEEGSAWKNAFGQLQALPNSYHQTRETLDMCKLFIDKEVGEHFDTTRAEQGDMKLRSMEYFRHHDRFDLAEFGKEVLHHSELIDTFAQYKQQYEVARQVNVEEAFDIHPTAVQQQQKFFKSILKLDKNFHVYVHGRRDMIEKGYDEAKGKHFYKLYFDAEN